MGYVWKTAIGHY